MGILERIKEIELEISRTQKNKATTTHIGLLKSQLARLQTQLLMPDGGTGGQTGGFAVAKSGDGRVALIGKILILSKTYSLKVLLTNFQK